MKRLRKGLRKGSNTSGGPMCWYTPNTLCEVCEKACGGCPWSKHGVQRPVYGWDAIRKDIRVSKDAPPLESYIVLDCPLFELEERHRWAYEKFDPEAIREQCGEEDEG